MFAINMCIALFLQASLLSLKDFVICVKLMYIDMNILVLHIPGMSLVFS